MFSPPSEAPKESWDALVEGSAAEGEVLIKEGEVALNTPTPIGEGETILDVYAPLLLFLTFCIPNPCNRSLKHFWNE